MTLYLPPPPQALQEKVESLQRRLHASEKKLFSRELESEEKVTQSIFRDAAPSEAPFFFAAAAAPALPPHCSHLQTLRLIHVSIVCQLQVEHRSAAKAHHSCGIPTAWTGSYVKPSPPTHQNSPKTEHCLYADHSSCGCSLARPRYAKSSLNVTDCPLYNCRCKAVWRTGAQPHLFAVGPFSTCISRNLYDQEFIYLGGKQFPAPSFSILPVFQIMYDGAWGSGTGLGSL